MPAERRDIQEMEKQINERLAWITISKKFKDWAIKHLHELHEEEKSFRNDIIKPSGRRIRNAWRKLTVF